MRRYDDLDRREKVQAGRLALERIVETAARNARDGANFWTDRDLNQRCVDIVTEAVSSGRAWEAPARLMADTAVAKQFRAYAARDAREAFYADHLEAQRVIVL